MTFHDKDPRIAILTFSRPEKLNNWRDDVQTADFVDVFGKFDRDDTVRGETREPRSHKRSTGAQRRSRGVNRGERGTVSEGHDVCGNTA